MYTVRKKTYVTKDFLEDLYSKNISCNSNSKTYVTVMLSLHEKFLEYKFTRKIFAPLQIFLQCVAKLISNFR